MSTLSKIVDSIECLLDTVRVMQDVAERHEKRMDSLETRITELENQNEQNADQPSSTD